MHQRLVLELLRAKLTQQSIEVVSGRDQIVSQKRNPLSSVLSAVAAEPIELPGSIRSGGRNRSHSGRIEHTACFLEPRVVREHFCGSGRFPLSAKEILSFEKRLDALDEDLRFGFGRRL